MAYPPRRLARRPNRRWSYDRSPSPRTRYKYLRGARRPGLALPQRRTPQAVALASLRPDCGNREPEKGWDAADAAAEWENLDALRRAAHELAKEPPLVATRDDELGKPDEIDLEISRLAKLRTVDYEQVRREAAVKLGIRASILDKLVAAARPPDESAPGKGRPLELPAPEPWPESVNGAALVPELTGAILKYVVLTENDALAVAMWILHAYCFDAFACTPRLAITAPEKRCGKTTLLDVIGLLVPRPLSTANISAAATFRTIEAVRPSLLIDEADTFLSENEELRGILNSGHRKGGQVIRTVGDDFEVRAFSTHTPVAIAQIGKLPDTLADRSVHISMKRRAPGETVSRLRHGRTPELSEGRLKGYELDAFSDLFARYIPGFQSVTPRQMNEVNDLGENQPVTRAPDVTVQNQPKQLISFGCHGVTDQTAQNGYLRENSAIADGVSDPDDAAEFEL